MAQHLAQALTELIDREFPQLQAMTDEQAAARPQAGGWSHKEELGHLIDSAANNHIRFVKGALEDEYRGASYDQNGWVRLHGYHDLPWRTLIDFWRSYNLLLAHVVARIPDEKLSIQCTLGSAVPVTLEFLINDYRLHMQHHLDHIVGRDKMTTYPGAAIGV